MNARTCTLALVVFGGLPVLLPAQIVVQGRPVPDRPIRPPVPVQADYRIRSVDVQADIHDQAAKVRLSQVFENAGSSTLEAQLIFPLPDDAAISELTLLYDGKELPGKLMGKDDARRIYESIVRRQRDPALLEYVGRGLFQTSVFPIPPHSQRKVEIRYAQLLRKNDGLVDFLLPLGTFKHVNHAIETFGVTLRLQTEETIKTVYSPTHSVAIERPDDRHATCTLNLNNVSAPDDLRILYGTQSGPVGMSLVSFRPNEKEDGYFMLMASPDFKAAAAQSVPKTAIIVVDRSGSMSGEKIDQARQAVKFFLHQLKPEDTFNVVAYDSEVSAFRPELQRVSTETINAALSFADGLSAGGGTNIHSALTTALAMLTDSKRPSYVFFLTDGVPTVGEQNELKIVAAAKLADKIHARIFNLGIGYDVNSRLLDRLSRELAGQSVYVRPKENIETYVSTLAKKVGSPLLTDVAVRFEFDTPTPAGSAQPIDRTYPRQLTDMFAGEQLVWVGRYRQVGRAKIVLAGTLAGKPQTFTISADLAARSVGDSNAFVEKVWATRRIGEIIDELDLHGQNRELVEELVQLSMKHGILTPYTSFLADDRVELAKAGSFRERTSESLSRLSAREGLDAFDQREAKGRFKAANRAPSRASDFSNRGAGGGAASPAATSGPATSAPQVERQRVLNVGQKTFYWKNERWQDAEVPTPDEKHLVRIKQFSKEYFDLAARDNGRFAKVLAQSEPLIVALDGTTYLIEPPKE